MSRPPNQVPTVVPADLAAHARYLPSAVENQPVFAATNLPPTRGPRLRAQPASMRRKEAACWPESPRSLRHLSRFFRLSSRGSVPQGRGPKKSMWLHVASSKAALAGIWAEVLGVEQVGRSDVFFELEGDSLKMVQIIVRVLDSFGVELPISFFFEHPTIEAHAKKIIELRNLLNLKGSTETTEEEEPSTDS